MDYFNNVLTTFLGLKRVSCIAVLSTMDVTIHSELVGNLHKYVMIQIGWDVKQIMGGG